MKKLAVLITILILFISVIVFLAIKIQDNNDKRDLSGDQLSSIPPVEVYNLKDEPVKLNEVCTGRKTIIVCFDTGCEICHIEAREFLRLQDKFRDSQIMFISNNPIDEIRQFITDNKLENSGYFFLNDRNYQLVRNYDIPTTPFILLYIDNKLYKSYKGGINIEQIIRDKSDR